MAQALDPAAYVHEGFWTDWTKGSTQGLTLTLCPTYATFLTNSLALFVTLSGGQLWTIIRFSLHQLRATSGSSGAMHNQQQVVLRNATTDLATARLMCVLAWRSRRSANKVAFPAMYLALFAVLHAIVFMIAGTFSNKVINSGSTTAGSAVLSRSKRCGTWNETYFSIAGLGYNPSSTEALDLSVQYMAKSSQNVQLSLEYAQECYVTQPPHYMSSTCNTLKNATIAWTEYGGSCPFNNQNCHEDAQTTVMDTGFINSHYDLGINAKPSDRLSYRRLTTCSVLNDTGYIRGWNGSTDDSYATASPEVAYAYYGESLKSAETDFTYSFSNFASFYTNYTTLVANPYQINSQIAYGFSPETNPGDFVPITELEQKTADLNLFFLSFTGRYLAKIEDPWFSAHQPYLYDTENPVLEQQYARDAAISTMGCTEQHQFCTNNGTCTPLLGFNQVQFVQPFNSALNGHQNATFDRMLRAVAASNLKEVVSFLARTSTPMSATNATISGSIDVSLGLPTNQWLLELRNWHAIAMAQLQRTIVQWGTGQIAPEPQPGQGQFLIAPQTEQDSWFCNNLMIPSTVYQSFSVLSIILIVTFGTLVIIISLTIENLADCIRRRCRRAATPLRDWDHDDMLNFQDTPLSSPWRPVPPPKDVNHQSPSRRGGSIEMARLAKDTGVSQFCRVHSNGAEGLKRCSSQALPAEHLIYPFPTQWLPPQEPTTRTEQTPQSERLDPQRDSWVAISLNSYDAVMPEAEARSILEDVHVRTKPASRFGRTLLESRNLARPRQFSSVQNRKVMEAPGTWI